MEREVRYCTTEDGIRIAYCVEGSGPPLLVVPNFIGSFSLTPRVEAYDALVRNIGRGRQLILYDVRGTGLSQRNVADLSPEATLRDVQAVVDALKLERFAVWGTAIGGPRSIEFTAANPDRVERLVLLGTFVRILDAFSADALRGYAQVVRANWEIASKMMADLGVRRRNEQEGLAYAKWYHDSIDAEAMARYMESHAQLDVTPALSQIQCPALVIHHTGDPLYPFSGAQEIAQGIPAARLLPLEGEGAGGTELPLEAQDAIIDFLDDGEAQSAPAARSRVNGAASTRTVLFTDLVGHTEMMSRLGDEAGRALLREHENITREVLKLHRGIEVKTMGDGFMASFGSVTRAVDCAIALQRAIAERASDEPLNVRVGINAGEPIEEDGDLFGATVILASRIAAKADGGEILVADTVRGLCSGKGFLFADRGDFVAKGFEEPVRVYEVRWRD